MSTIQESREAVKRLDRLTPNLAHICRSIWEWIHATQIALSRHKGQLRGFRGQTFKSLGKLSSGWTDWHQLWFTSADSSGNGHRLNTIRPSISQGSLGGGGFRGSHIQKSVEAVKRLDRLAQHLAHMCRFIWEWIYAKQIALRDTRGTWGFRGSNIQTSGEAVKLLDRLAPTVVPVCGFIWEWT